MRKKEIVLVLTHNFFDWETICSAVGSVEARVMVIIGSASENCESKLSRWSKL